MKKFLKRLLLFVLMFLVIMYFIGSCTERPEEYKPKDENSTPAYTELTPDEYQRQMNELVKRPPVTKTSFKSPVLQAHASELTDLLRSYWEETAFFDLDNWKTGWNDIKDIFSKDNADYPSGTSENPEESATVPFQYEFYGKNRVVYNNGTYEIIECRIFTTGARSDGKKTGVIKYTRTNQYHQYTSFSFDISVREISRNFNSNSAFSIRYYGLKSYTQGLSQSFISNYLEERHFVKFLGSSKNSIYQFNINDDVAVPMHYICYDEYSDSFYPNVFSISSTLSNDYEFTQSVNNYYINNKYWRFPNVYYNNRAGDKITQNNVKNYNDYGYTYNSITNSIEFDPNVFADFFDLNIKPQLELAFKDIFSHFPDINATYSDDDTTINYNDLVTIMHEIQSTTTTVVTTTTTNTYPIETGDVTEIYIQMTFPEEYYETYAQFNTEPDIKLTTVSISISESYPDEVKHGVEWWVSQATGFLHDAGFFDLLLVIISASIAIFVFL